jgi:chromate transporter
MEVKFSKLLKTAFWIGLTGYGGPALVSIMKNKFVEEHKWIEEKDFLEGLSLSQILPGAFSVSLIGYLGYRLKGFPGILLLPFFFLLPAFFFITGLTWVYMQYGNLPVIKTMFIGLGALVVALVLNAIKTLSKSIFGKFNIKNYKGYLITITIFCLGFFLKINVIYLILLSCLFGFLLYNFSDELKNGNAEKPGNGANENNNTVFNSKKFVYLFLSLSALILICFYFYFPLLWQIFFTFFKIGLFGFGGGYTVIPLIQHQVVQELGWVTLNEFRDGIAMGQITPGPVFITTTFIGFKIASLPGAITATIASFSPSLMAVIFLGRILIKIRHKKIVQAFIKGILSGFMGLLLMVVLQFGMASLFDWKTFLIFAISIVIIMYLKKDPIWAILFTAVFSIVII